MKNSADLLIEEWNLPPSSIWRHRARQHQSHKTLDRWDSRDSILSRKISIQTWNQEHKLSVDWLKYMPQIHQCWICVHQLSMDFQYTLEPNLAFSGSGLYLFKKERKKEQNIRENHNKKNLWTTCLFSKYYRPNSHSESGSDTCIF